MISKELISEVLNKNIIAIDLNKTDKTVPINKLSFIYEDEEGIKIGWQYDCDINIYELAHKCKELALTQNYYISEGAMIIDIFKDNVFQKGIHNDDDIAYNPKNVFKACQWILDNKDNQ